MVISIRAFTTTHLVKQSTITKTNYLLPVALGNGPRMSIPHCENGQGEVIAVISIDGCRGTETNL